MTFFNNASSCNKLELVVHGDGRSVANDFKGKKNTRQRRKMGADVGNGQTRWLKIDLAGAWWTKWPPIVPY